MKKHIVIDARLYGPKHTGIGRYTKNLLIALKQLPNFNKYKFTLIVYKNLSEQIRKDLGDRFNYFETDILHYSIKEQLILPFIIYSLKPDLVHFTHFNKPLLFFGNSVVTIHDLIKHFFKGKETTTRTQFLYWIKYVSYLVLINTVIKTSKIIVPSNYWRDYLIKNFKLKPKDITTTHEAVDPNFFQGQSKLDLESISKPENYIIYTGNLYPHKNINIIFQALKQIPDIKLKIICARSFFSQKIEKAVAQQKISSQVKFLGYLDDKDFKNTYQKALALVHPSFMEGFSLTGLEAMALNCPVVSSNSSCLPEIYQDSVLYFDPHKPNELISQINKLKKSPKLRNQLILAGNKQFKKYSWIHTATETLDVYQNLLQ